MAVLLVALAATALRYLALAKGAIAYPYGLDYGEGIVWQQMRMMVDGHGYAPLRAYPAIVFHYPPLFHLLSAATAALAGIDQLAAGRLVAVLCTLASAALAGTIVAQLTARGGDPWPARLAGVCAAAIVLGTSPVVQWSVLMRVDMPCQAFSLAGMALSIRSLRRPRAVHGAALCFVAALFAKQTALDAPAAAFLVLLIARPRAARAGLLTAVIASMAALAAAMVLTEGGFLRHIVLNNVNRFCLACGLAILDVLRTHAGYIAVAAGGIAFAVREVRPGTGGWTWRGVAARLRDEPRAAAFAMLLAQLVLATPMLALRFKSGASVNYFLDSITLIAMFDGVAIAALLSAPGRLARAIPWVLALQAGMLLAFLKPSYLAKEREGAAMARLAAALLQAPGPVIADDMVVVLRAGKQVVVEPSIFAELSGTGALDDGTVLRMTAARRFAAFLTEGDPGERTFDSRYNSDLAAAMARGYPQVIRLDRFRLRLPPGALPAWAAPLAANTAGVARH